MMGAGKVCYLSGLRLSKLNPHRRAPDGEMSYLRPWMIEDMTCPQSAAASQRSCGDESPEGCPVRPPDLLPDLNLRLCWFNLARKTTATASAALSPSAERQARIWAPLWSARVCLGIHPVQRSSDDLAVSDVLRPHCSDVPS